MAVSEILGLFQTPEQYTAAQDAAMQKQFVQRATLDPFQKASVLGQQTGYTAGQGIGGALGGRDPQLEMISRRNVLLSQLNPSDPSSYARVAEAAAKMGDMQAAQALAMQSQTIAKQNQERLKLKAETKKLETDVSETESKNLNKQQQVQQLINQFGMEETQATAIASNADLLKQYLTPRTQQGFELLKSGKFLPKSVIEWVAQKGELEVIDKMVKPTQDFISKAVELKFGEKGKYGDYTSEQVAAVNKALFNETIAGKKASAMAVQIPLGDVLNKVFQSREREDAAKAFSQAGDAYTITVPLIKKLSDVESTVSNAFTGAGQNYKLALSKGLSAFGVKISDRATDTEFGDAISAQVVQQIAKVFPGSQSNKELDQLLKSKFNLQQELPTILRLVGQIKDEMLSQTKTYEQMANLPDGERTNFNAKLEQGKNYQKIQKYRALKNKANNLKDGQKITRAEYDEALALQKELGDI